MTQEQWIIYLYGIYPNGGFTLLYIVLLASWVALMGIMFASYNVDKDSRHIESMKGYYWVTIPTRWKVIPVVALLTLIFLSNLVPSKNTFLMLVATPTVVDLVKESAKDGKLKQMDSILDKALNKLEKELE